MSGTDEIAVPELTAIEVSTRPFEGIADHALVLRMAGDRDVACLGCTPLGVSLLSEVAKSVVGVMATGAVDADRHFGAANVRFSTLSAQHLPLADASVDLIVIQNPQTVNFDTRRLIAECHRAMRDGATLVAMLEADTESADAVAAFATLASQTFPHFSTGVLNATAQDGTVRRWQLQIASGQPIAASGVEFLPSFVASATTNTINAYARQHLEIRAQSLELVRRELQAELGVATRRVAELEADNRRLQSAATDRDNKLTDRLRLEQEQLSQLREHVAALRAQVTEALGQSAADKVQLERFREQAAFAAGLRRRLDYFTQRTALAERRSEREALFRSGFVARAETHEAGVAKAHEEAKTWAVNASAAARAAAQDAVATVHNAAESTVVGAAQSARMSRRRDENARRESYLRAAAMVSPRGRRRRTRVVRTLDAIAFKLGPVGQALMIRQSALWDDRFADLSDPAQQPRNVFTYALAGARRGMAATSLFDHDYYVRTNPDLSHVRSSPLAHYLRIGDREGRAPHPLFSSAYYRQRYGAEVAKTGLTTFEHFVAYGAAQGFSPHSLFDTAFYVGQSGEIADSGENPLAHYLRTGWREGLSPHPLFDNDWYLETNPDVGAAMTPPLVHYVLSGGREGRDPHPQFSANRYLALFPNCITDAGSALSHYLATPAAQRSVVFDAFDGGYYHAANHDVAASGVDPLSHFLVDGVYEGRRPSQATSAGAFLLGTGAAEAMHNLDAAFGVDLDTAPDALVVDATSDALRVAPLFDVAHYQRQAGAVADAAPIEHYLREGWLRGFDPHPLFSNDWYLEGRPDLFASSTPPLLHYVNFGAKEGADPHPLFWSNWYRARYPDVGARDTNPLLHFLQYGAAEGRDPSPLFHTAYYLASNPDLRAAGLNALAHYLQFGIAEHRAPNEQGPLVAEDIAGWTNAKAPARVRDWLVEIASEHETVEELGLDGLEPAASGGSALFEALSDADRDETDTFDYAAYERTRARLREEAQERLTEIKVTAPYMTNLSEVDLRAAAQAISFLAVDKPTVSILIPVYNNVQFTLECLTALQRSGGLGDAEIIVIDDASNDRTAELIPLVSGVRYVRNTQNLGFLLSCNGALPHARGEVVVYLNNDTQAQKNWLAPLVDALLDDPLVGAVAPKLIFPNGRLQEAGARIDPAGKSELIGFWGDPEAPRFSYPRLVDYASGACLAVRREDIVALGGFDTHYAPAYCEDADLCFRLRRVGRTIIYQPKSVIVHHLSVTSNAQGDDYKSTLIARNQQRFVERWSAELSELNRVRTIAFYLPQFHSIRENDAWWGPGFTEWTNVTRALPNYVGQYQPHRPADLGFYDLTKPGVMEAQAALADRYGIDGFCYYYYWFSGRRVLEAPLERMLETGRPSKPFCLCWANENWTRTWDGLDREVLLVQGHEKDDAQRLIADMARFFSLPTYIRVDGRPLVVIYRPNLVQDLPGAVKIWRDWARANGHGELYLAYVENFEFARTYRDPKQIGFDASIEFPPSNMSVPMEPPGLVLNKAFAGHIGDYRELISRYMADPTPDFTRFRGVMPSWDNTARRQDKSQAFHYATPGAFQAWLEQVYAETLRQNFGDERIVFVNAWNEWAEGAHLEPDARFGHGWLEAVRNARDASSLL